MVKFNLGFLVIICNTIYVLLSYFVEYPLWFDVVYITCLFLILLSFMVVGKENV